jgi:hypothetical protein
VRSVPVAALLLLSACGGTGGTVSGTYSCAEYAENVAGGDSGTALTPVSCVEISGGTTQDLANNQQSCAAAAETFSLEPCPLEGAIGGCRETVPAGSITTWYYQGGPETLSQLQTSCAQAASAGVPSQFVMP